MSTFDRRRVLSTQQQLMAVGAGVAAGLGVGVVVFYFARLMLQRQRLHAPESPIADPAVADTAVTPAAPPRATVRREEAGRHG